MAGETAGPPARRRVDLDGTWEFVTDPLSVGREEGWHDPGSAWPERARTVEVPVAWEELDAYREYVGVAWYRRTVEVPAAVLAGRAAALRFGAVDYEATVWVNGNRVGANRGGYLPFELDVTDAVSPGRNTVTVRVEDPADLSEVPHGKQGDPWYTRVSGVWQSVDLLARPPTRVVDARVTPDLSTDTATVAVETATDRAWAADGHGERGPPVEDCTCAVRAIRDGEVVARSTLDPEAGDRGGWAETVLSFDDPAYWSPEDPALYDLDVTLRRGGDRVDRYADTFGMRSVETDGDRVLLNGDPVRLRGVLEQGYYPGTLYRPHAEWSFEREVRTAKDLGFNLVRKHVKPPHPAFLDAADRAGVLVWAEPATPTRDTERSRRELVEQVHGMVARDYNRPSVVVWSLYNEEWGLGNGDDETTLWTDEERQRFLADQYESLRELDPTRLVCDNSGWAHVATDLNDYHRYFPSPDRATAWDRDLDHLTRYPADNYATTAFDDPDAPVLVSECGTWGLGDVDRLRPDGEDPPWFGHEFLDDPLKRPAGIDERFATSPLSAVFENLGDLAATWRRRQCRSVAHVLGRIRARESVSGYVLTQLSDVEWEFNGLLAYDRTPKPSCEPVASVNAPLAVVTELDGHAAWADETVEAAVSLVNDTGTERVGELTYELGDREGRVEASVGPHGVETVDLPGVPAAADGPVARRELRVTFRTDDRTAAASDPVTVVHRDRSAPAATVYATGPLASRLGRSAATVTHGLSGDVDLAFARRWTDDVERFAAAGGTVVRVPERDGRMADGAFAYRDLPEGESWTAVAGFWYHDSPLLAGVTPDRRLGWAFEGLYPRSVATDVDPDRDRVHVGYVEGWLANPGSPLVARDHGDGRVLALTLRVPERYGTHPVATLLVGRVIERFADGS